LEVCLIYPLGFASLEIEANINQARSGNPARAFFIGGWMTKKQRNAWGKQGPKVAPLVRGVLSSKAKGEIGELAFLHKAASLGFGVAMTYGDNERYDFILDSGERLWRVQVKSTYCTYRRGYRTVGYRGKRRAYTAKEIDFLVVYIAPRNMWYVIPVRHLAKALPLNFYPSGSKRGAGYFEFCRDAWYLMAPGATEQSRILPRVHAMVCGGGSSLTLLE
jgi:hypothetical protein